MGSHSEVEQPPPPKNKPRYRFVVAICGIVALAFIAMAVVAAVFPEKTPAAAGPDDTSTAANPFPPLPTVDPNNQSPGIPTGAPPATTTGPAPTTAGPRATTPPAVNPGTTTAAPGPAGPVFATYTSLQSWADGFQGQVTLTNTAETSQSWQLRIVFGDNVTHTSPPTAWIDGMAPPAIATESHGATYVGSVSLAPHQTVILKFQYHKTAGSFTPVSCTVNGHACSIN